MLDCDIIDLDKGTTGEDNIKNMIDDKDESMQMISHKMAMIVL